MKFLVAFFLCGLSTALFAQPKEQTFTGADGTFQFKYSNLLVRCTEKNHQEGYGGDWTPTDSCMSYFPICDDPESQGSTTLVCFAYPKDKFKDYPTFEAATFSVAEIKRAVTEKECLGGSPDWAIDPRGTGKIARINHVKFKTFEPYDFGMMQYLDGRAYRNFHRNTCYELTIRTASANAAAFDGPAKELTEKDWKEVNGRLEQALDSFKFLK